MGNCCSTERRTSHVIARGHFAPLDAGQTAQAAAGSGGVAGFDLTRAITIQSAVFSSVHEPVHSILRICIALTISADTGTSFAHVFLHLKSTPHEPLAPAATLELPATSPLLISIPVSAPLDALRAGTFSNLAVSVYVAPSPEPPTPSTTVTRAVVDVPFGTPCAPDTNPIALPPALDVAPNAIVHTWFATATADLMPAPGPATRPPPTLTARVNAALFDCSALAAVALDAAAIRAAVGAAGGTLATLPLGACGAPHGADAGGALGGGGVDPMSPRYDMSDAEGDTRAPGSGADADADAAAAGPDMYMQLLSGIQAVVNLNVPLTAEPPVGAVGASGQLPASAVGAAVHSSASRSLPADLLRGPLPAELFAREAARTVVVPPAQPGGMPGQLKEFAPTVFAALRARHGITGEMLASSFHLPTDQMKLTLGAGRSGSLFLRSRDNRYLLKTIPHVEVGAMLNLLPQYFEYISANVDSTFLMRVLGVFRITQRARGARAYAVVFDNVTTHRLQTSQMWDLKGRVAKRGKAFMNRDRLHDPTHVHKDKDLERVFYLPSDAARTELLDRLDRDTRFLCDNNMMDYSLLVGVLHIDSAPTAVHETSGLSVLHPLPPPGAPRKPMNGRATSPVAGGAGGGDVVATAAAMSGGGLWWRAPTAGHAATREVLLIGIIDMLTAYNTTKALAHICKRFLWTNAELSTVVAPFYRDRLMRYAQSIFVVPSDSTVAAFERAEQRHQGSVANNPAALLARPRRDPGGGGSGSVYHSVAGGGCPSPSYGQSPQIMIGSSFGPRGPGASRAQHGGGVALLGALGEGVGGLSGSAGGIGGLHGGLGGSTSPSFGVGGPVASLGSNGPSSAANSAPPSAAVTNAHVGGIGLAGDGGDAGALVGGGVHGGTHGDTLARAVDADRHAEEVAVGAAGDLGGAGVTRRQMQASSDDDDDDGPAGVATERGGADCAARGVGVAMGGEVADGAQRASVASVDAVGVTYVGGDGGSSDAEGDGGASPVGGNDAGDVSGSASADQAALVGRGGGDKYPTVRADGIVSSETAMDTDALQTVEAIDVSGAHAVDADADGARSSGGADRVGGLTGGLSGVPAAAGMGSSARRRGLHARSSSSSSSSSASSPSASMVAARAAADAAPVRVSGDDGDAIGDGVSGLTITAGGYRAGSAISRTGVAPPSSLLVGVDIYNAARSVDTDGTAVLGATPSQVDTDGDVSASDTRTPALRSYPNNTASAFANGPAGAGGRSSLDDRSGGSARHAAVAGGAVGNGLNGGGGSMVNHKRGGGSLGAPTDLGRAVAPLGSGLALESYSDASALGE